MKSAIVIFSGGQDSTTCLYWAIQHCQKENVHALTFDYGQRHRVELQAASKIAEIAGVAHTVLPIDTFSALGGNALTDSVSVRAELDPESNLPNTFVAGRNLIFLTYAAAFAYKLGVSDLITGVAQTDYSGYPDCRAETIEALQQAINLGMESNFHIHTPLMNLSKKETVVLASNLGALDAMAYSHTCYEGQQPPCGACPACLLRAGGFTQAGIADPLVERLSANQMPNGQKAT